MFLLRVAMLLIVSLILELILTDGAWAWGPAVHTVIACTALDELSVISPMIAAIIRSFPLEYIYGTLAADFFVGKGKKKRDGHPHTWETAFRFLGEANSDREAAYGYGFLSHLAADVVAHNYFVPNLIHRTSTWKRMGHIYWEATADYSVGPPYLRIARDVLDMEQLGCDELLKSAVGRRRNGLKTGKHLFTQTLKLSEFLSYSQPIFLVNRNTRHQIPHEYLAFMIDLSYRLVKDFLTYPDSSPCLSYDPVGRRNLRLASRNGILSKFFNVPRPMCLFTVDQELLKL